MVVDHNMWLTLIDREELIKVLISTTRVNVFTPACRLLAMYVHTCTHQAMLNP